MKPAGALLILWLTALLAPAQSPLSRLERVFLFDRDYVRLADWAAANHFAVRWPADSKDIEVTNSTTRLLFTVDSRRAEINGVAVWLSLPVAARQRTALVGALDFQTLVQPILFPARDAAKIKTICLDPGHGGKDPGNLAGKSQEKQFTLLLAKEVQSLLLKEGFKVVLTRTTDSYPELPNRPERAKLTHADLFVSLHFNSAGHEARGVRGLEVYCLTPAGATSTNARGDGGSTRSLPGNRFNAKNVLLAYQLQKQLVGALGAEDRGLRRARFVVLNLAEMPAVLIEGGFMTDAAELKRIADPAARRKQAQAIVDGLLAYQRLVERGDAAPKRRAKAATAAPASNPDR